MPETSDMDLMREFARNNTESAFAELVQRHIHFVYSVALRYVGNSQDAQDVTQAVFIILAQKAASLRDKTILSGWLYETTRFTSARFMRSKFRRQSREQEVHRRSNLTDSESADAWQRIEPLLEEAMSELSEKDRTVLALHFFEKKTAGETAALLGIHEAAARKRVARAVEKLRTIFDRRGVSVSAVVIVGAVSANSVQAAPATFAASVSALAITKGAAASTSTLTLIKGTLKMIAWAKMKTAIVVGAAILLTAGTATVTVQKIKWHGQDSWRDADDLFAALHNARPQVQILPAKSESPGHSVSEDDKTVGIGMGFAWVVEFAYGKDEATTIIATELPPGNYDFIANLEQGSREALQREIKNKFGIIGRLEASPVTNRIEVLRVKDPIALKLTRRGSENDKAGMWFEGQQFRWGGQPSSQLANWLERYLKTPVVDQTGLTNGATKLLDYDFDLNWSQEDLMARDSEKLRRALAEIGFELISTNQSIEMLVVEKTH